MSMYSRECHLNVNNTTNEWKSKWIFAVYTWTNETYSTNIVGNIGLYRIEMTINPISMAEIGKTLSAFHSTAATNYTNHWYWILHMHTHTHFFLLWNSENMQTVHCSISKMRNILEYNPRSFISNLPSYIKWRAFLPLIFGCPIINASICEADVIV